MLLVAGALMFLIMPLYVGALVDDFGFDNQQVSLLTAAEMIGMVVVSLVGIFVVRKVSWRQLGVGLAVVLMASNLISFYLDANFQALLLIRFIGGLSSGGLVALAVTALGDTENVDRNFAFAITIELLLTSVVFVLMPVPLVEYGVGIVFLMLAVFALLALFACLFMPSHGSDTHDVVGAIVWTPMWGLLGSLAFFVGASAVWAFVERIGVKAQFSSQFIGNALSLSTMVGLVGAFSAAWVCKLMSRKQLMILCAAGQLLALCGLLESSQAVHYLLAGIVFQFFWNLWLPIQMASIADADTSGRFTVVISSCQALGVAIGPPLAVSFMTADSFMRVNVISGIFIVIALLLFMPIHRHGSLLSE